MLLVNISLEGLFGRHTVLPLDTTTLFLYRMREDKTGQDADPPVQDCLR
jgi:hypothetical protein